MIERMRRVLVAMSLVLAGCSFELPLSGSTVCGDQVCGAGWTCTASQGCVPTPDLPDAGGRCGDHEVQPPEECDDGDGLDENACTGACRWAICGDGVVRRGVEDCEGSIDCESCQRPEGSLIAGHRYLLDPAARTFADSATSCAARGPGWHLAVTPEGVEWDLVSAQLTSTYYVGATDAAVEGRYTWIDGEQGAVPFNGGQPQGGTVENCTLHFASSAGLDDVNCATNQRPSLCERDPALVSELDHHAYLVSFLPMTDDQALALCAQHGLDLARLTDPGEVTAVIAFLPYRVPLRVSRADTCMALDPQAAGVVAVDCLTPMFVLCEAD